MLRTAGLLFLVVLYGARTQSARAGFLDGIPEEYKKILFPVDFLEYIESLTLDDANCLRKFLFLEYADVPPTHRDFNYIYLSLDVRSEKLLNYLKNVSSSLYQKTEKMVSGLKEKRSVLGSQADRYVEIVYLEMSNYIFSHCLFWQHDIGLFAGGIEQCEYMFENLPRPAKKSLHALFPGITAAFKAVREMKSAPHSPADEKALLHSPANLTSANDQECQEQIETDCSQILSKTMSSITYVEEVLGNLKTQTNDIIEEIIEDSRHHRQQSVRTERRFKKLCGIVGRHQSKYNELSEEEQTYFEKACHQQVQ